MKVFPYGLGIVPNIAFLGPPPFSSKIDAEVSSLFPLQNVIRSFSTAVPPRHGAGSNIFFSLNLMNWGKRSTVGNMSTNKDGTPLDTIKIGIIGGGICGNAVAHSLAKKLLLNNNKKGGKVPKKNYEIVVLEGDPHSAVTTTLTTLGERQNAPPQWCAATARNANSIVPGSSMHVFSRKSVLWQVIRDTVNEWYYHKKEYLQNTFKIGNLTISRQDDFDEIPPYFALHLWKCLGPSASSDERWSFIRFFHQFLYSTLLSNDEAANERGRHMCDLAKANRDIFLREFKDLKEKGYTIQYSQGFVALYRSLESARHSMETTRQHEEEAQLLPWEEAVSKEPHLQLIPVKPLYAVYRPNEIISSCEEFFRAWTQQIRRLGVQYRGLCLVDQVEVIKGTGKSNTKEKTVRYRVRCKDHTTHEFDILVLAAGVHTPLLAAQIGVGDYVPTYPLRGYSLTTFVGPDDKTKGNLLKKPFSVDSMYCTSVTPRMARWAGFGEFVGYPGKDHDVPSLGPSVLSRYTKSVFPRAINGAKEDAVWCFRPVSPDDLPLVGAIPKHPGLFVHHGHGTLGWTTGLATGHCVAQTIAESLGEESESSEKKYFEFPNNIKIERQLLSPTRFVSKKTKS